MKIQLPGKPPNAFMKKAEYEVYFIEKYIWRTKSRFQRHYDIIRRIVLSHRSLQRGKWQHLSSSDSDSSNGMEYNEFTSYMGLKRDSSVTDTLSWWKGSQAMYSQLSKMARDILAVPATDAGVERKFSISECVIIKQWNRLAPSIIWDIMQYKHWLVRHEIVVAENGDESEITESEEMKPVIEDEFVSKEKDNEKKNELWQWLKEWEKKERVSDRINRLMRSM